MNGYEMFYGKETEKLLQEGARIKTEATTLTDSNNLNTETRYLITLQSMNGKTLFTTRSTESLQVALNKLELRIIEKYKKEEIDRFPFKKLVNKVDRQRKIVYGNRQFHGWEVRQTEDKILIYIYKSGNVLSSFRKDSEYSNISLNLCNMPLYVERDKTALFEVLQWIEEYLSVSRETRLQEFK